MLARCDLVGEGHAACVLDRAIAGSHIVGVYVALGWERLADPAPIMQRHFPGIYSGTSRTANH